jgi:hypothetical protein
MRIACWIPEATNTQSEYVIIIAFPLQKWLHDASHYYVVHTLPAVFIFTWNTTIEIGSLSMRKTKITLVGFVDG